MSKQDVLPPVTHIPIKHCSMCGIPALGGSDYCLTHTRELDYKLGKDQEWEYADKELDDLLAELD